MSVKAVDIYLTASLLGNIPAPLFTSTEVEVNSSGYLQSREADTEVNNCLINRGPKSNFICDNIPTKAILFFIGCPEVNNTWLITSELANQHARKELFACVIY